MTLSSLPLDLKRREEGRVLIVDADPLRYGELSIALRTLGHRVQVSEDGHSGLRTAMELLPDVVMISVNTTDVDARTFLDLLRENPATNTAKVFLVSGADAPQVGFSRDAMLTCPFHVDEVAHRIDHVLRSLLHPQDRAELRGQLERMSLVDLLQLLAQGKKSGDLRLRTDVGGGGLVLAHGIVTQAWLGPMKGKKALVRLLQRDHGQFVFSPASRELRRDFELSVDHVLMEAAVQTDEMDQLAAALPAKPSKLRCVAWPPPESQSRAHQLLAPLRTRPTSLANLLDAAEETDVEVLRAVLEGIKQGWLETVREDLEPVPLASADDAMALATAAARLRKRGYRGPIRLAWVGPDRETLGALADSLPWVESVVPRREALGQVRDCGFARLGVLRLPGSHIELMAVSSERGLRPAWSMLLAPVRLAIFLGDQVPRDVASLLSSLAIHTVPAAAGWQRPEDVAATLRGALLRSVPRSPLPANAYSAISSSAPRPFHAQ